MTLVSIITPTLNQGQYIEETILSVLSQTYSDIEYIVIDGGSSDSTLDILDRYSDQVSVVLSEPDSGQSSAINKGIALSSGEILMWLNSDDILLPHAVACIVECFYDDPDLVMLHGHSELFGEGMRPQMIGLDPGDFEFRYPSYIPFPQPSSFFRRRLISQMGLLDESLHYAMDFDLLLRAFLLGSIRYLPVLLSRYRIHETSKTSNTLAFVREWSEVFSRFLNSLSGMSAWKASLFAYDLYNPLAPSYSNSRDFDHESMRLIVFYHLETAIHMLYQAHLYDEALRRINYLRIRLPDLYSSSSLPQVLFRIRFLPTPLLRLIRDFHLSIA